MPAAVSHRHRLLLPLVFLSFLLCSQARESPEAADSFRRPFGALLIRHIHPAPLPTFTASRSFRRILQIGFDVPSPPLENGTLSPPTDDYSPPPPPPSPSLDSTGYGPSPEEDKTGNMGLVVGISSVCVVVTMILVTLLVCWCKRMRKASHPATKPTEMASVDVALEETSKAAQEFSYAQLADATGNFSCKLGEGGFGSVYKGDLLRSSSDAVKGEQKSLVAIKRMSHGLKQGFRGFMSEVTILTQLRHRNLVKLHGWCQHSGELFLVYEHMSKGSLDMHLFGGDVSSKAPLEWPVRYKIVKGLASALYYMHSQCDRCVLHRDIKSSNVLLDADFNAKFGDFGLARLTEHDQTFNSTLPAGTLGYLAPECLQMDRPHKESDVFSFGVVVLEIVCGRKPFLEPREVKKKERVHLVDWVRELHDQGKILEAIDPRLQESYPFSEHEHQEIKRLIFVGLWCAHPDFAQRPSMTKVIGLLNIDEQLTLPTDHPSNVPEAIHKPGPDGASVDTSASYSDIMTKDASMRKENGALKAMTETLPPEVAESFYGHDTPTSDSFCASTATPLLPTAR